MPKMQPSTKTQKLQLQKKKSLCVCVNLVKKQVIKEILQNLINQNNRIGYYTKEQIEKAIMQCRGADPRTIQTWFKALFRLEYLIQPQPNVYNINIDKIVDLEIDNKIPIQVDRKQKSLKLFLETHTHKNSSEASEREATQQ